jgi:hypothetical protein
MYQLMALPTGQDDKSSQDSSRNSNPDMVQDENSDPDTGRVRSGWAVSSGEPGGGRVGADWSRSGVAAQVSGRSAGERRLRRGSSSGGIASAASEVRDGRAAAQPI